VAQVVLMVQVQVVLVVGHLLVQVAQAEMEVLIPAAVAVELGYLKLLLTAEQVVLA
jgi:hypothetical protein